MSTSGSRPEADGDEELRTAVTRRDETAGLERVPPEPGSSVNEVHLVGRLGSTTQERTLPSGDVVVTFHVVVDRVTGGRVGRPNPSRRPPPTSQVTDGVDALACAVWSTRGRRTVKAMEPNTWVEVDGSLRRRFRRGAVPPVSFYEVEVARVRRVR